MRIVDGGMTVSFAVALFFWLRGLWKRSVGDLIAGAVLFVVATCGYFQFVPYSSLSYLPAAAMLVFALASLAALFKKPEEHRRGGMIVAVSAILAILSVALFMGERKWESTSNSLLVIEPYKTAGTWVFDDPRLGLNKEPFVAGIPELIDHLVSDIPNADKGFRLIFSAHPFPAYDTKIVWRREGSGGNWYYSEQYKAEGWLCPALFKYFRRAPREIYVKAEAK